MLTLRPAESCLYDCVSLGEIMLRLDPGECRVRVAREFKVWEGGGEYNVARGLRKCFGLRTAVVTAFADNDVGRLVEDFIMQGGVDVGWIKWVPYDGIGRNVRVGLNFTERGYGIRGAKGIPDRGNTAASQLKPGDIDWEDLFGNKGVRWFHTGGIFAALSDTTPEVVIEAVESARRHGTIVSYDLNYRPSLWKSIGGKARAQEVNRRIARSVDVMIGNEEDFTASLGDVLFQLARRIERDDFSAPGHAILHRTISELREAMAGLMSGTPVAGTAVQDDAAEHLAGLLQLRADILALPGATTSLERGALLALLGSAERAFLVIARIHIERQSVERRRTAKMDATTA
jgi:2-dehydro-3-deoxygluconokinase